MEAIAKKLLKAGFTDINGRTYEYNSPPISIIVLPFEPFCTVIFRYTKQNWEAQQENSLIPNTIKKILKPISAAIESPQSLDNAITIFVNQFDNLPESSPFAYQYKIILRYS